MLYILLYNVNIIFKFCFCAFLVHINISLMLFWENFVFIFIPFLAPAVFRKIPTSQLIAKTLALFKKENLKYHSWGGLWRKDIYVNFFWNWNLTFAWIFIEIVMQTYRFEKSKISAYHFKLYSVGLQRYFTHSSTCTNYN